MPPPVPPHCAQSEPSSRHRARQGSPHWDPACRLRSGCAAQPRIAQPQLRRPTRPNPSHSWGHGVSVPPRVRIRGAQVWATLAASGCGPLCVSAVEAAVALAVPRCGQFVGLYGAGALLHSLGWREPQLRRPTQPIPISRHGPLRVCPAAGAHQGRSGLGHSCRVRLRATARFGRRGCGGACRPTLRAVRVVSMGKEWAFTALSQVGAGFGAGAAVTSCSLETNVAFPGPDAASGERRRRKGGPNALGMALMLVHREAQRRFVGVVAFELLVELKGVVGVGLAADRGRPMQRLRQV